MTYLAIPITAKNIQELQSQCKLAKDCGAEIIELRTDHFEGLSAGLLDNILDAARVFKLPLIVTCRDAAEGGVNDLPEELRVEVLCRAVELGAEYVDCEYANYGKIHIRERIESAFECGTKTRLILSAHNFHGNFEDLQMIYDSIIALNSDAIPKIVYTAKHINDCFEAFDLLHDTQGDLIVLCMGKTGLISRILAGKLGAYLTFACIDEGKSTAPGQISANQMKQLYRFDKLDKETRLFGLIADPVGHSLSPAIHNASFASADMNCVYVPIQVEGDELEFDTFLDNVRQRPWLDFHGFSVSIPHKSNALEYLRKRGQYVEPLGVKIGAINTIALGFENIVSGYNTDYAGALYALKTTLDEVGRQIEGSQVAIIGAGGVARAIVAGLCEHNAQVVIFNRTVHKAQLLANEFKCGYDKLENISRVSQENFTILINCTSVGMYPDTGNTPVPREYIKANMAVFDTIYNPRVTMLLREASEQGALCISGIEMFLAQAMEQFEHFTHQKADKEVMLKAVFDWLS